MKQRYSMHTNMEEYPLFIVRDLLVNHKVDKWARVRNQRVQYSIALKDKKVREKKHITLEEAQRIVGELYGH